MLTEDVIRDLRAVIKKHQGKIVGFAETRIDLMAMDCLETILSLQTKLDAQTDISCALGLDQVKKRQEIFALQAELDALKQERRWVRVGESLPNIGGTVIMICDTGEPFVAEISERLSDKNLAWWTSEGWFPTDRVTHWQPLPEPPMEDAP